MYFRILVLQVAYAFVWALLLQIEKTIRLTLQGMKFEYAKSVHRCEYDYLVSQ
jgi:hypothetical protein